jgi:hypothetical protein
MSFLREAAVDLIIALQNHGIPKEIEVQFSRLCQECTRSAETETAMLKRKHSCPEWDYMVIDEDSPEFEACLCYAEPEKEWVGLTDEELRQSYCEVSGKEWCLGGLANAHTFYEAIEAKLKEKNHANNT